MSDNLNSNQETPQPDINIPERDRKKLFILALLFLALVVGGGLGAAWNAQKPEPNKGPSQVEEEEALEVTITKDGFVPATLKISKGTTVTWTNKDTVPHLVASNPHPEHTGLSGFEAETPIEPDNTYSYTFDETGTYTYHDHLSPTSNGTIIVE